MAEPWEITEEEAAIEGQRLKARFDEADRLFATLKPQPRETTETATSTETRFRYQPRRSDSVMRRMLESIDAWFSCHLKPVPPLAEQFLELEGSELVGTEGEQEKAGQATPAERRCQSSHDEADVFTTSVDLSSISELELPGHGKLTVEIYKTSVGPSAVLVFETAPRTEKALAVALSAGDKCITIRVPFQEEVEEPIPFFDFDSPILDIGIGLAS